MYMRCLPGRTVPESAPGVCQAGAGKTDLKVCQIRRHLKAGTYKSGVANDPHHKRAQKQILNWHGHGECEANKRNGPYQGAIGKWSAGAWQQPAGTGNQFC